MPMRQLNVVPLSLKPDQTVAVVGDVQGMYNALTELIAQIKRENPQTLIIFIGDLIDMGPQSKECLQYVKKLIKKDPSKHKLLCGNHESHLCGIPKNRHLDEHVTRWWNKGCGWTTLESYGWKATHKMSVQNPCRIRNLVKGYVDSADMDFTRKNSIDSLFINEQFFIVHGSLVINKPIEEHQLFHTFIDTHREPFLNDREIFHEYQGHPLTVIHGHSPHIQHETGKMLEPCHILRDTSGFPRRINTDTGASFGPSGHKHGAGILSAFCFQVGDTRLENSKHLSVPVYQQSARPYEG